MTNLHAKKVLCHCAEVAKDFRCCNHRLCFLQCDWQTENSLQKVINVNEARGIDQMSPDPLLSWVGLDMRLAQRCLTSGLAT